MAPYNPQDYAVFNQGKQDLPPAYPGYTSTPTQLPPPPAAPGQATSVNIPTQHTYQG